jgi:DNA-binding transcriptional ArsR family regulator
MADIPYIAESAALIGDPARANMLSALKDDGVLSATELAHVAGVAPNTASGHLARLIQAGMITVECKGRHRYYSLACHEVAEALEALEALAANIAPRHRPRSHHDDAIRYARSCYDHLAGRLGVRLAEAFMQLQFIKHTPDGFALLDRGKTAFVTLGIDMDALKAKRRRIVRYCPDWSEREAHLGGALAAELFEKFCDHGWLRRQKGTRAVSVTPKGKAALRKHFRMEC